MGRDGFFLALLRVGLHSRRHMGSREGFCGGFADPLLADECLLKAHTFVLLLFSRHGDRICLETVILFWRWRRRGSLCLIADVEAEGGFSRLSHGDRLRLDLGASGLVGGDD